MLRPPRHPQPPHRSRRIGLPGLAETAPTGSRSAKTRRPPCRKPFRQNRPQSGTRPVRFRPPSERTGGLPAVRMLRRLRVPLPQMFGKDSAVPASAAADMPPFPLSHPPPAMRQLTASGIRLHSGTRMPQTVRNLSQAGRSAAFGPCSRTTIFMKSIFYDSHFSNSGTELVGVHVERRPQRLHPADATTKHGSIKTIRL